MSSNKSKKKTKPIKKRIYDIVTWVLVFLLFGLSIVLLFSRRANGVTVLFGNRYDVVLSTSMSYKNDAHLDFLEGHDDQIQKMDVVKSKEINKYTELNVYDIVIYKDPYIGTNMHRIVDKRLDTQDELYLSKVEIKENGNILLNDGLSRIYSNDLLSYKQVQLSIVSNNEEFSDGYYISFDGMAQQTSYETKKNNDGTYTHILTMQKDSDRPGKLGILHSKDFDFNSEEIQNITVYSYYGKISVDGNSFSKNDEDIYCLYTNQTYSYEIRGDAAKDSDGWFTIDKIYSKVNRVIPKVGILVRFITSIPGIIMFAAIGVLLLVVDFVLERDKKRMSLYFVSDSNELTYTVSNDKTSEENDAELVGKDKYSNNIFLLKIDNKEFKEIEFKYNEKSYKKSLKELKNGEGLYVEGDELKTYTHTKDK